MKQIKNKPRLLRRVILIFLLVASTTLLFYSCSQLGIISKTDRIDMFIADLNNSIGDQGSANEIMANFSESANMYEQIKTIDWWESSVLGSANITFKVNGLTESNTDDTVTGTITSDGGLDNDDITFTMVRDPHNYFGWLIGGITIKDSTGAEILTIN